MNTIKYTAIRAFIFIFAFSFVLFAAPFTGSAQEEARIVKIFGGDSYSVKSIRLDPETLMVGKGTVVIWNNWARTTEVKIVFEDGKTCKDVTEAPMGFSLDAKACYVTTWVPLGGTSSLRFVQAGTYKYEVETNGGIKTSGKIVIQ